SRKPSASRSRSRRRVANNRRDDEPPRTPTDTGTKTTGRNRRGVMATEREAELAREQHADDLRRLGAHAIAVDEVGQPGDKDYAVMAYFENNPTGIPSTLEVKSGKKKLTVPLVARVQQKFTLE